MKEFYTEHKEIKTCPVCNMQVSNVEHAIKFVDPKNSEEFFFDTNECYKQFLENPEQIQRVDEEEAD